MHPLFLTIARLHREGIRTGFLSSLGDGFLALLYQALSRCPFSVVIVAIDDIRGAPGTVRSLRISPHQIPLEPPSGFVAGTTSTRKAYQWIVLRYGLRFGLLLAGNLFRPKNVRKILETLLYSRKNDAYVQAQTGDNSGPERGADAELLSIAVDSSARGRGVGKVLIREMEQWLKERGIGSYKVVTLASDSTSNPFYVACGFLPTQEFVHHGNAMRQYRKQMDGAMAN